MADPFTGEIRMFAGNFAPRSWALCNGQLLPVSQNDALFSLVGTIYGGDGRTTFGLPDLRGRAPLHAGQMAAAAQPPRSISLAELDVDGDGEVTRAEFDRAFASLDRNRDGKISAAEARGARAEAASVRVGTKGPQLAATEGAEGPGTLALNFIIALHGIYPSRS